MVNLSLLDIRLYALTAIAQACDFNSEVIQIIFADPPFWFPLSLSPQTLHPASHPGDQHSLNRSAHSAVFLFLELVGWCLDRWNEGCGVAYFLVATGSAIM